MNTDSILKKILNRSKQDINPYPGLRPFQMDEHPYFFGREKQTRELIDILKKNRFISVIGTSGSGKSSLVRAGMLPFLYKGMMSDDAGDWSMCTFRPGVAPIDILVDKLFELSNKNNDNNTLTSNTDFEKKWIKQTILDNDEGILHAYQQLNLNGKLLLVIDQFEEIFRYKNEADDQNEMARAFVHRLIKASRQNKEQIYICITMRSDFLGDCSEFYDLPEVISKGMYLVPRLERNELRRAISAPAKLQNATVDPSLVDRLINDLEGRQDQLPLLQHALMRTFQIWKDRNAPAAYISMTDYRKSGTMDRALSDHGDSILKKLKADHPDEIQAEEYLNIAKKLFQSITQKSGEKGIRRPASLKKISRTIGVPQTKVIKVINYFRDEKNSLLMPPIDKSKPQTVDLTPESIIDISHESLMRIWHRLKDWVEEEEEKGRRYKRIYDAYQLNEEQLAYKQSSYLWGRKLNVFHNYLKEINPTNEWAERYGGKLEQVTNYIEKSYRRKYRTMASLFGLSALIVVTLFASYIASNQYLRSYLQCYNTEIEASKTNGSHSLLYSIKTLNILEESSSTWGKRVFDFKNRFFESMPGSKKYVKISTEEMKQRVQENLIPAFNQGTVYNKRFDNIKQFAFSNQGDHLFTINNKNEVERWNLNNKEEEPLIFIPKFKNNGTPSNIFISKDDSTVYVSFNKHNDENSTFIAIKNGATLKKKYDFEVQTKYSKYSFLSPDESFIHSDQLSLDLRNTSDGKVSEKIKEIKKEFPNANSISFPKNNSIAIIEDKVERSNDIVYYVRFLESTQPKELSDSLSSNHFEHVEFLENQNYLMAQNSESLKIWSFEKSAFIFNKKGYFQYSQNKNYFVLGKTDEKKIEIIDLANPNAPIQQLDKLKRLGKDYGFPNIQFGVDTTLLFPYFSNKYFLRFKLPLSPSDNGKTVKVLPRNTLLQKNFTPQKDQEFIRQINDNNFIEFDKNIITKNSISKFSSSKEYFGSQNELGELFIWDLRDFSSSLIGHTSGNFYLAGFKNDSLLAYTRNGIYSLMDSTFLTKPKDYNQIMFSNDMKNLLATQRENRKILEIIPMGNTSEGVQTITSKYPIIDYSINKDEDKVALISFRFVEGKSRLTLFQKNKKFKKLKTINFHNEISMVNFPRQTDEVIVTIKDDLIFLPFDFKGEKIDTIKIPDSKSNADSSSFKIIKNNKTIGSIPGLKFPSKITTINSFINENKKEIWMVGLENGEVHILTENREKNNHILVCGNYNINEIQQRVIETENDKGKKITMDEIIVSDNGAIYIFRKNSDEDTFKLFNKLETKTPAKSIFFNQASNLFYTVGENGFIKKWFTDYKDFIGRIKIEKIEQNNSK
ncbi:MAG: ATP-binding protein [Saprospiraceae bacterium]